MLQNYRVVIYVVSPSRVYAKHGSALVKDSITKRARARASLIVGVYIYRGGTNLVVPCHERTCASHAFLPFGNSLSPILPGRANTGRQLGSGLNGRAGI
jgi:hypothetical protein